jgi:hypothetical protein
LQLPFYGDWELRGSSHQPYLPKIPFPHIHL